MIELTMARDPVGEDLVIEVFSWLLNGNPAPKVRFAWRCWSDAETPPVE